MQRSRSIGLLLGLFAVLALTGVRAEDSASLLEQAWNEYEFLSHDIARDLFGRAEREASGEGDRREAQLGLAMVDHFRETGRKLDRAIETYRGLLDAGASDPVGVLATSLLAEALSEQGSTDAANGLWDEVISGHPDTIVAQDALLRRTLANLGSFTSAETAAAVRYVVEKRAAFPEATREKPGLSPSIDYLLGSIAFWREEYGVARDHFGRVLEIGSNQTGSYSLRAGLAMRMARISEEYLDDPEGAGRGYRELVLNNPNDVRAYFALIKAIEYGSVTREELEASSFSALTKAEIADLFAGEGAP